MKRLPPDSLRDRVGLESAMAARVVPMLHVPDVRATASWYASLGFALTGFHADDEDGEAWDWACLRLGATEVMLSPGGRPSDAHRREVDLYVQLDGDSELGDVDSLHARLAGEVEVVQTPYDAFHGNRELIIRDPNRFWITFGQPIPGWAPPH